MTIITLYKGGGISFSPIAGEGRVASGYVRLVAADGKVLTNDIDVLGCVDVREEDIANWYEIAEEEIIEPEEALSILMGESE